ncbi:MAG: hypothetical protein GXP09_03240 [Gammaproteobacteria bacterium]|nr:hypothetical protein [Gammaproteobacteria bacterium]
MNIKAKAGMDFKRGQSASHAASVADYQYQTLLNLHFRETPVTGSVGKTATGVACKPMSCNQVKT